MRGGLCLPRALQLPGAFLIKEIFTNHSWTKELSLALEEDPLQVIHELEVLLRKAKSKYNRKCGKMIFYEQETRATITSPSIYIWRMCGGPDGMQGQ